MRSWTTAAVLALALAACASRQSRPDLLPGAPVAMAPSPVVPLVKPAPQGDLMLVNPLECLKGMNGTTGDAWLAIVLTIVCLPVLGAVDLVALPILAAADAGRTTSVPQWECSIPDPAPHAADVLIDGLVAGHGMVRAAEAGPAAPAQGAFRLEVATERFLLSGAVSWNSRARLLDPDGQVTWEGTCEAATATTSWSQITENCEVARAEVTSLGDQCARRWLLEMAGRGPPPAHASRR